MGQTTLKAKMSSQNGGSISYTTSSVRHSGNERIYFGDYNGQQRVGITFPSLASQLQIDGEDINKIRITRITLNLYRNGGDITDTSNYYIAISNEVNYLSFGNDGRSLNEAVNAIETKELKGPMNGIVSGANAITISGIDMFKDIISNNEFYLYMYSASPAVLAGYAQIAGSDVANAPTITVDWIYTTSSFTSDNLVTIGHNYKIILNISNSSYTHKAVFQINNQTYDTWDFSAGVSTIEKPVDDACIDAIPITTDRIGGTLTIITYASGAELGRTSKAITFLIPKDKPFLPTGTLTLEQLPESTEAYVDRTYWNFTLEGSADKKDISSATVTNWHVYRRNAFNDSYGDWSSSISSNEKTFTAKDTSPSVSTEGTYTWYAEITNSRGFTVQVEPISVTIGDVSYDKPIKFNNIKAYRTDSSGTEKAEGTWYKLSGIITANDVIKFVTIYDGINEEGTTYSPKSTSYDLSNIPAKETGTTDLTASKSITIAVVLNNGATDRQVVTLLSAAYMLYFKKGGNALGIGKVTDKDNLLDIGWKTAITCSGSTDGVLALVGGTNTENSMSFGLADNLPVWKMGYDANYSFFLKECLNNNANVVSITYDSTNKITLKSNGWTVTFNSDSIMFTSGEKQYSISNLSESGRLLTGSTFDKDVWIKYSGTGAAPRLFLSTGSGIQAEVLTTGQGLQFRNSVASNYGSYYDEYVFPPTSASLNTSNTHTIYTSRNIIFNRTQPSNPIPGTIWLQPVS